MLLAKNHSIQYTSLESGPKDKSIYNKYFLKLENAKIEDKLIC